MSDKYGDEAPDGTVLEPESPAQNVPANKASKEPTESDTKVLKKWSREIKRANKANSNWEDDYEVDDLLEFWRGRQWVDNQDVNKSKYVINLVYANVETRIPSLVFYRPNATFALRPGRNDDPSSTAYARIDTLQNTVNTLLSDRELNFMGHVRLSVRGAHFRFGVIEVGYSADVVDNPNAGKPILGDNEEEMKTSDGNPVVEPVKTISDESFWVRNIPAKQFRVSIQTKNFLTRADWAGYYEWVPIQDVKADPDFKNTDKVKSTGKVKSDREDPDDDYGDDDAQLYREGMVKIWKVWDPRAKKRYVMTSDFKALLKVDDYKVWPFAILRFHDDDDNFLPMPPVQPWLCPQREVNEIREMERNHRRRALRRYLSRKGMMTDDEKAKLESGEDFAVAEVNGDPNSALVPVQDAPLDRAISQYREVAKMDFQQVSGISAEMKGVAQSETATQASIIDKNAQVREQYHRLLVADFICDVVSIFAKTLIEYATLPLWVKTNVDKVSPNAGAEAQAIAQVWKQIKAEDLGEDFNWDVTVDIESMTPVTENDKRNQWNSVLQVISSPAVAPLLMASEPLLRKTLRMYDIRDEQDIQAIKQAFQAMQQMRMQEQAMQAGAPPQQVQAMGEQTGGQGGPGGGQAGPQPQAPPGQAEIEAARQQQMGQR